MTPRRSLKFLSVLACLLLARGVHALDGSLQPEHLDARTAQSTEPPAEEPAPGDQPAQPVLLPSLRLAQAVGLPRYVNDAFSLGGSASASATREPVAEPATRLSTQRSGIRWSYGLRFRVGDLRDAKSSARIRPALGLRWGRWRMGTVEQSAVDSPTASQRQPSLGYQWLESDAWDVQTSVRLHNVSTGESAESLSSGTHTARGRVVASHKINGDWALLGESTLDLLGRGDGVTASFGVGHTLARGVRSNGAWGLGLNAATRWASARHWQTAHQAAVQRAAAAGKAPLKFSSGIGELGLGLSYTQQLTRQWVAQTGLSHSIPLGQVRTDVTQRGVSSFTLNLQRYEQ